MTKWSVVYIFICTHIFSSSMALQPEVFLVGKCAFCSEWPVHWPHKFLLNPDETARAIWQSHQETWVTNGRLNFAYGHYWFYSCPKVLLHAVNLRHGTEGIRRKWCSGFLSPNPRTLGPVASTLTTSPPRATIYTHIHTYKGHTQNNGAVLIMNTIKTAPFFCVCPVY
jgi:hypothetical protein